MDKRLSYPKDTGKRYSSFIILLGLLGGMLFLGGCSVGVGVGVETRVGIVYFASSGEDVFGDLYLDGAKIGVLIPGRSIGKWVFLDFKHEVELHCGFCGVIHSLLLTPPLRTGQVIVLEFSHQGER